MQFTWYKFWAQSHTDSNSFGSIWIRLDHFRILDDLLADISFSGCFVVLLFSFLSLVKHILVIFDSSTCYYSKQDMDSFSWTKIYGCLECLVYSLDKSLIGWYLLHASCILFCLIATESRICNCLDFLAHKAEAGIKNHEFQLSQQIIAR